MRKIVLLSMAVPILLTACAGAGNLLPASVYYLDGPAEAAHVWRLEADGITKAQLTQEDAGVDDFAVSPTDGSLAFVSENRLFLVDGDGENRRLVADDSQVDKESEDYVFRGFIEAPVLSPDGRTLAYAFDGLHLYNLETAQDAHVLTNLGNLLGEPFVFVKENYFPGPWSPDGSKLLIIMGYFEGSTLAVMDPEAAQPFTRLRSDGPVCARIAGRPTVARAGG
jgi:Tol biopolymer transport system component